MSTLRASAAAKPEKLGRPSLNQGDTISTQKASTKRPATIDGMPVMTSTKKRIAKAKRPRPYSTT